MSDDRCQMCGQLIPCPCFGGVEESLRTALDDTRAEIERLRKALLDATLTIGHRDHELRVVKAHEASLLEALIHRDHEVEHLRAEIGRLRPVAEGLGAEAYRLREFIREVRDADDTELLGIRARAREALAP